MYRQEQSFTTKRKITIKKPDRSGVKVVDSRFIELRSDNSVDLLKRHFLLIKRLLQGKNVKLTFLHLPVYSIQRWNQRPPGSSQLQV